MELVNADFLSENVGDLRRLSASFLEKKSGWMDAFPLFATQIQKE